MGQARKQATEAAAAMAGTDLPGTDDSAAGDAATDGKPGTEGPAAEEAATDGLQTGDGPASLSPDGKRRVVCTAENAGTIINGKSFTTLEIDGAKVHISQRLRQADVDRFVRIPGYQLWNGDEARHARAIEDALEASRQQAPAPGTPRPVDPGLKRENEELRRANHAGSADLRAERERADRLTDENTTLRKENEELKAAGHRTAAAA